MRQLSSAVEQRPVSGEDLRDALVKEAALPGTDPDRLAGPFAHIVVDEAQELTDAEWQMLLLRCPSRSFTIVGDRAQSRGRTAAREPAERAGPPSSPVQPAALDELGGDDVALDLVGARLSEHRDHDAGRWRPLVGSAVAAICCCRLDCRRRRWEAARESVTYRMPATCRVTAVAALCC